MAKKFSKLEIAQQQVEAAARETNWKINELGNHTSALYISLNKMQSQFDRIRNVPEEKKLEYEKLKEIRIKWKQQAEKIEVEYKKAEAKAASQGAAGIGVGVAVAALGPKAAMGVATMFGVASTGTPIASLSGAAATNAALAWLGGGALAAGGGGMAAGSAFLTLAGPVGWAIAGVSVAASGFMFIKTKSDKERLENIYTLISERDTKSYKLAIAELSERINRIVDESEKLSNAIRKIETFGTDYREMTTTQQYELGSYVNLMEASTMLLVNPILGLQPKYSEEDFEALYASQPSAIKPYYLSRNKMIISMANLLYNIPLDDRDRKLLAKTLKKNKEFLSSVNVEKSSFDAGDVFIVQDALEYKRIRSK